MKKLLIVLSLTTFILFSCEPKREEKNIVEEFNEKAIPKNIVTDDKMFEIIC